MGEPAEAVASLEGAVRMERAVRTRSQWYAMYLWLFAAWQLLLIPMLVLWRGHVPVAVSMAGNAVIVAALSLYAARQPVVPRRMTVRHLSAIGGWTLVYGLTLVLAFIGPFKEPGVLFTGVAAICCALPPALVALNVARSGA
ncbi:hypothetical protein GCM10010218_13970 [Streptomyces mashuensis]|uniref:Uncharacterized protein n=1 Tax=Streptomyces mashuensis TaxID=33904 RepID=A0A919AZC3_9ACTN|nr:hypothetical protein [Streptomyces mashuensis]GHF34027.1 hypothetical protein GCM10010218_13970 [Streptomyces mashuensis]